MKAVRVFVCLAACLSVLSAQDLQKLDYTCSDEDIHDFGLTCSEEEPCRVFLELSGVNASGSTVFLTGNLHTEQTTLYGLLLSTEDGGKTWTEPAQRLRSASLDQIEFADLQHGWVSGVKLEPLPRDPFLLLTTDGGKTWRPRPLTDDVSFGSILQFWFDSPDSGELILDRSQGSNKSYEIYGSMTGGNSWEIRETTRTQPTLSKARRDAPTWRIRVDAPAKVYRVEKRVAAASGTSWETIASFSVLAAECK
jgi:hypothetical protein